nr:MAG TPA: hypothetical protein [Caudoviricetes sp.]
MGSRCFIFSCLLVRESGRGLLICAEQNWSLTRFVRQVSWDEG